VRALAAGLGLVASAVKLATYWQRLTPKQAQAEDSAKEPVEP
jgi:hypothetical protein